MPIKPPKPDAKGVQITPRDEQLCTFLYEMRVATMPQLARLAFDGSQEAAQKRLRMLVNNLYLHQGQEGLLERIFWLARKGLEVATEDPKKGELKHTEAPSWTKAKHDLLAGEIRIFLLEALRLHPELQFGTWIPERQIRSWKDKPVRYELASGKTREKEVVFDGFFTIKRLISDVEEELFAYGLEVDRKMHANVVIGDAKVAPGIAYIGSTMYKARFQVDYGRYLFVTDGNDDRLEHMLAQAAAYKRGNLCYFTNTARLSAETFFSSPIWFVPNNPEPIVLIPSL